MNLCILSGRVGQDPRISEVNDTTVANMSIAVQHDFKKDDEGNYLTMWFKAAAWGKTAEFAQKFVKKGCKVLIHGEIQKPDSYESDHGTRVNNSVRVNRLELLTWPDDKKKTDEEVPF